MEQCQFNQPNDSIVRDHIKSKCLSSLFNNRMKTKISLRRKSVWSERERGRDTSPAKPPCPEWRAPAAARSCGRRCWWKSSEFDPVEVNQLVFRIYRYWTDIERYRNVLNKISHHFLWLRKLLMFLFGSISRYKHWDTVV